MKIKLLTLFIGLPLVLFCESLFATQDKSEVYVFSIPKVTHKQFTSEFASKLNETFSKRDSYTERINQLISTVMIGTTEDIYNATAIFFPPDIFEKISNMEYCQKEFRSFSSIIIAAHYEETLQKSTFKNIYSTVESKKKLAAKINKPISYITPEFLDYFAKEIGLSKRNEFLKISGKELKKYTISLLECAYIKSNKLTQAEIIREQYLEFILAFKNLQQGKLSDIFKRGMKYSNSKKNLWDKINSTNAMIDEGTDEDVYLWALDILYIGEKSKKQNTDCEELFLKALKSWGHISNFSEQVYNRGIIRDPQTILPEKIAKELARQYLFGIDDKKAVKNLRNDLKQFIRCMFAKIY